MSQVLPLHPLIDFNVLDSVAEKSASVVQQVRHKMLAPNSTKIPISFNSTEMAELIGLDKSNISYTAKKYSLPAGTKDGARLSWTLAEARQWTQCLRANQLRNPKTAAGVVITVANYKGGVTKTTTAAALAQGLSLRGHKCLFIDTDPQGSGTTLFGILPDIEVDESQSIMPIITGETDTIMGSIQKTYWDGIDLVAAGPQLASADFILASRQSKEIENGFEFWKVLDSALDPAREIYDVIIIDTPPNLSFTTINALMAAQGLLMPLPPNSLDFASSAQFWNLLTELCGQLYKNRGADKKFHFIDVVLARVDKADAISQAVKQWILRAYQDMVIPVELPKTSIAATASAEFGTVYDLSRTTAQAKTLKRARDAYEQLVDYVEAQVAGVWASDASGKPNVEME